jgi:hypothetical protein
MSTVPNYVGTSTEVQGTNNVEAVGQNVATKLGPKHVHYINSDKQLPSLFVTPVAKNRLEIAQEDAHEALRFSESQNQLFDIWPSQLDDAWQPHVLDRAESMDNQPSDPFKEYSETMLRHNALFNIKIMRAPSN